MNKSQLLEVLESCLLSYEGLTKENLELQGLESQNILVGIKLKSYLESKL